MKAVDFKIDRLIEYLTGTCYTIEEGLQACFEGMTEDDLTEEDHAAIDNEIFRCDQCSWWHEVSDEATDEEEGSTGMCTNCYEDGEENED